MKGIRLWFCFIALTLLSIAFSLRAHHPFSGHLLDEFQSYTSQFESAVKGLFRGDSPEDLELLETSIPTIMIESQIHLEQPYRPESICRKYTAPRENLEAPSIYKWIDSNGQTHFSDKRPTTVKSQDIGEKLTRKPDLFSLNYNTVGLGVPAYLNDQISYSTRKMYAIMSQALAVESTRKISLNVTVFGREKEYEALRKQLSPNSTNNTPGFYSHHENLAVVLNRPSRMETGEIAIHEASHVVTAGLFGATPRWFTEGFAEYFENMEVEGQLTRIKENAYWLKTLRQLGARNALPFLGEYWEIPRDQWESPEKNTYYAIAWSLIAYMMDTADRRKVFSEILRAMENKYCQSISITGEFNRYYPGGLQKLELEWKNWIFSTQKFRHRF